MTERIGIPRLRCPADVERLWNASFPPLAGNAPDWVIQKPDEYRFVGIATHLGPADLEEFEQGGGVADELPGCPGAYRLFITRPWWDQMWSIGMREGPSPLALQPMRGVTDPVLTRDDVSDICACFVADPFMLRKGNRWHLFFEVMDWRTGRGAIALATSEDAVNWQYQGIALAEPFHLSYPCIFEWEENYYMVPESYQAGQVRLYRAAQFPSGWSHVATLLEGDYLVDSSLVRLGDLWWLFVDASPRREHDTLRVYWSRRLEGPWMEHPKSPIVSEDRSRARPAGRALPLDGRLIRLAQDCRAAYGAAVRAFEVTELTTTSYQERPIGPDPLIGPAATGWNAGGMHHIDAHRVEAARWLACVDGWVSPLGPSLS